MSDSVKKVSINRIIGNVIGNLGLKNTNNIKDDFARWACEAESKIGSTNSYRKYECELEIRNKRATLPPNFCYLNAIKLGNRIIPITKRSFTMFYKGAKNTPVDTKFANNQLITNTPGVALVIAVTLSGAFMTGDIVNITVTANNNGTITSNTFSYIVQVGDSLTMIAAALTNQINAITTGYTASPGNDQLLISGLTPELSFTIATFADSATGFVNQSITQQRVPPRINNQVCATKQELMTGSNNLANGSVVKLNTGINAQGDSSIFNTSEDVFSIDNGCINFNSIDGTRIGISYMGVDLDEDGWPLVAESHEDAVAHYIMYMFKSVDFYNGKLPQYVHQELKNRWFDLCSQARGDDELPNSEEMKYLSNMWMQLIPLPSKENF